MKKYGFLLLAAISATSALAGEVDAQYPQAASATLAFATVDNGVSTSWTSTPINVKASADHIAQLQDLNAQIDAQVSEDLEQRIAEKMELSFAN